MKLAKKKKEEFHFGQHGYLQSEEEVKSESKEQAEQIQRKNLGTNLLFFPTYYQQALLKARSGAKSSAKISKHNLFGSAITIFFIFYFYCFIFNSIPFFLIHVLVFTHGGLGHPKWAKKPDQDPS